MAEDVSTGTSIVFKVGGVAVAGETDCGFQINGTEVDLSNKSTEYWSRYAAGRSNWTANGSGMLIFDGDTHTLEASQKAIFTAISTGADVEIEIAITDTLKLSGTAFFTNFQGQNPDAAAATLGWAVRGKSALALTEGGV